ILFSVVVYSLIYYYRDLIFGPPVLFWDDDYIEINLYPGNYNAAVIFTIDDIYKLTEPEEILNITEILDRYSIKGVFFVIPYYKGRYKINKDDPVTKTLIEIEKKGHEIAQHGLTHWVPRRKLKIVNYAREFTDVPYSEQKRRIAIGKKILEEAGLQINGFRAPAFSANQNTLKVLDHLNFLYGSNAGLYPPPYMLANKMFVESIYYPYHPSDLNILEFVSHGDLFRTHFNPKNLILIKHRFGKVYKRKGVFVLYTHIEPLNTPRSLKLLEESLEYINTHNVWKPTLTEIALWWRARESLYAETKILGDTLVITLEKGNELELKNLTILFKRNIPAKKYRVVNGEGDILKKGEIEERSVTIDY
ncbi:MAG: DUF2334 domain-containing protein, partial [Candidatus Omnitrophica bacterium]|nr:DUF2334 domain-containing protein [Candidatus Omnitrophota bacterium]